MAPKPWKCSMASEQMSMRQRREFRTIPLRAWRTATLALRLISANSSRVNRIVRWFFSSSFNLAVRSGSRRTTAFRWAWVKSTGKSRSEAGMLARSSRMGQRRFQVRYPGEEDCIWLMAMVRLEHELVPVVRLWSVLQELAQSLRFAARASWLHRPAGKVQPVFLARQQDVGRRECNVVAGQVRQ